MSKIIGLGRLECQSTDQGERISDTLLKVSYLILPYLTLP
jgi:hypothetical protein